MNNSRNLFIAITVIGLLLVGLVGSQSMMGFGPGMGPSFYQRGAALGEPIGASDALASAELYARRFGADARVKDLMPFAENYYAQIVGEDGMGIAEILIDRYTGAVYPEPGPNMMWNTDTGMRRIFGSQTQFGEQAARERAEAYLERYMPGATIFTSQSFPGYTTFDFGRGEIEAMLSVQASTGEVWVHTWHGRYLGDGDDHGETETEDEHSDGDDDH